jgi:hypothetical protein
MPPALHAAGSDFWVAITALEALRCPLSRELFDALSGSALRVSGR